MSQKTISSKPIIYLGIGKNKYYGIASDNSNAPIQFFPYGLFLRFSQDIEKTQGLIYDFFDNTQQSLPLNQREILLESQYFEVDCYIDCYFKTPTLIFSFLVKFNQAFVFKESSSNIIINKEILTARMNALMEGK